jgi:alkaline phosphatase D
MNRRDLFRHAQQLSLVLAGNSVLPALARAAVNYRFTEYPFRLGVASGYPRPDGVSLWTRLAPKPLEPRGGLDASAYESVIAVRYQLSKDETFSTIEREGEAYAEHSFAHSIHVDLFNLAPATRYFYRFLVGDAVSPIGRTQTAPAFDAEPATLKIAYASCAHYEQGYFANYRAMANDECDLLVHLGDYIYESSWGTNRVRWHELPEPMTLDDYRIRHALYRSDQDLQLAHASAPWALMWDDHEVHNDYAGAVSQFDDPRRAFLARRRAAYQAYYEHMPMPRSMVPTGDYMKIHTSLQFGKLANIYLIDDRQYRESQPCPPPFRKGGNEVNDRTCPERLKAPRSLLGRSQERWLLGQMQRSSTQWNVLAQQTLFVRKDADIGAGAAFETDGWDGYPQARAEIIELLSKLSNPVIIGGDVHAHYVADVHADQGAKMLKSKVVASEICGTSITSQAWPNEKIQAELADNPHIKFANSAVRGYVRMTMDAKGARADLMKADDVRDANTKVSVLQSFAIVHGRPGPKAV